MRQTLILVEDLAAPESWERIPCADVRAALAARYPRLPDGARLYHGVVAADHDVTPSDARGIARLAEMEGDIWCVLYPRDFAALLPALLASLAVQVISLVLTETPDSTSRNTNVSSQNNALGGRTNEARIGGRIADIFGTVRSYPDLLTQPILYFVDHLEYEQAYLCVGRGSYTIAAEDVRDGDTPVQDIDGMSVEVYGPGTSPNSGAAPQLRLGEPIGERVWRDARCNSVNGQTLEPPNRGQISGEGDLIRFAHPATIEAESESGLDFAASFAAGDSIVISGAVVEITLEGSGTAALDLGGTYTVASVSTLSLTLDDPAAVNADWDTLGDAVDDVSPWCSAVLSRDPESLWIGPFVLDAVDQLLTNVVCTNGCYRDNGEQQVYNWVDVWFELTPVDAAGDPTGSPEMHWTRVHGSATTRDLRASTLRITPAVPGSRYAIRARRTTGTDLAFSGSVVDEVKWRDLYARTYVAEAEFGNVTTIQAVTRATAAALALKERKLNARVTRNIPIRNDTDGTWLPPGPSTRAADILVAVCLDPWIGRRTLAELDIEQIYATDAEAVAYFGSAEPMQFGHTFDDESLSLEDTLATIAGAVFCTAYRQGGVLRWRLERATEDSVLLFCHRNKVPGSETRNVTFGREHDGVELTWVDPEDDSQATIYIPPDRSATNMRKVETVGVRNARQAWIHARRAWAKVQHQRASVEFEALHEAELLALNDRILVADNTRTGTQDGEVAAQSGLVLTLSQPVTVGADSVICLQHVDASVESIAITAGATPYQVVLAHAPRAALSLAEDAAVHATYQIVGAESIAATAYLVQERTSTGRLTATVTAINYDPRYYADDGVGPPA